jgi:hypothetical protein
VSRNFPDWLAAFAAYHAETEIPEKFVWWAGVATISSALERRCWIDQGHFNIYPNFFVVFVSDAGKGKKSTAVDIAMKVLKKVPAIQFMPKSCTWEGFVLKMQEMHKSQNQELDLDAPNIASAAVVVQPRELSVFLDPTDKGKVSTLIELWDCPDDFDKFTIYRGDEAIERPCVNLVGGTTPSWIRDSFDRWSKEGGLVNRIVFLYENRKRQSIAWPKRAKQPDEKVWNALVADVVTMTRLNGPFTITEEAYTFGEEWYKDYDKKLETGKFDAVLGFRDRKQTHVLKTAMVLSVSRRDTMVITKDDIAEAIEIVTRVEADLNQVFSVVDERAELRPYNDLRATLAREKEMEKGRLLGRFTSKYLLREMQAALDALVESGEVGRKQTAEGRSMLIWTGK